MTRHGIATIEAYSGRPVASAPIVAQWVSLTDGWAGRFLRPHVEGVIDAATGTLAGGRPLVYLESHLSWPGYTDLLNGKYDARLIEIRDSLAWAPGAIVRWDHEMDGSRNEWRLWGQMDPALYRRGWRHVANILGPMFFCSTSLVERAAPYYPGDEYVSFVGWDQYFREELRPLPKVWGARIEQVRTFSSRRVLVGEFGAEAKLPGRATWLKGADKVEGLWGACYFDVDRTEQEGVDWRMDDAMREVWG